MLELLLVLADKSDKEKIEYLARVFYDDLYRYAKKILTLSPFPGYEAEDVVQDTYVRITLKIDHLDLDRSDEEIRKYLKQMLRHIIADKRKEDPVPILMEDIRIPSASPDDFVYHLMEEHEIDAVTEALKALDDKYRVALTLKYREGFSPKRIAELLNQPVKTVYTHIARGLVLLKQHLEEGGWGNE